MYTEEERTALRRQLTKRRIAVILPAFVLLAVFLAALILRLSQARNMSIHDAEGNARLRMFETVCYVSGSLCAVWLILADGLFLFPLRRYERHLTDMLDGLRHETEGVWAGIEDEISEIDGVRYRAVSLIQTDEKGWDYDRRFYFDCEKTPPQLERGQRVRVTYHDKQIIAIAPV